MCSSEVHKPVRLMKLLKLSKGETDFIKSRPLVYKALDWTHDDYQNSKIMSLLGARPFVLMYISWYDWNQQL